MTQCRGKSGISGERGITAELSPRLGEEALSSPLGSSVPVEPGALASCGRITAVSCERRGQRHCAQTNRLVDLPGGRKDVPNHSLFR